MFSGVLGNSCFGPAEISAMRRALSLAEGAIRLESRDASSLCERRQDVARAILRLARDGHLDPLVLCAMAVKSRRDQKSSATFRPYERRVQSTRARHHRAHTPRKIA